MRSSTWRLEDLRNVILNLGFVGENLHTRQIFDCKKMFDQYPNASVSMTVTPPEGEPYPGTIERDGDLVIWDVRDSDLVAGGDGEIQLVFTQEPHIARSYNAQTHICRSQVPTGSIPSGLDDYITRADQLLDQVEDTFPAGGTTGQVLAKKSDTDYDTEWVDQGGGTEDYDELENRPQIGGVTLTGNKTLHDLGAASEADVEAKYTKPETGIPASDMAAGVIPDPEDLIDDEAGAGDTDKVWSADKSSSLLTEIAQIEDDIGTVKTTAIPFSVDNSYIDNSGEVKSATGYAATDFIDISEADAVSFAGTMGSMSTVFWYDSSKEFISANLQPSEKMIWFYNVLLLKPSTAKYLRCVSKKTTASNPPPIAPEVTVFKGKKYVEYLRNSIVGDGITDDTMAVRRMVNMGTSVTFPAVEKIKLTGTVNVQMGYAKVLDGNGITLIATDDFYAMTVEGTLNSSASPSQINNYVLASEGGMIVKNFKFTASDATEGGGIDASKAFNLRIENNYIYKCGNGIRFSGMNRDVIVSENHIFAINANGILFDASVNIHQCNIVNNIILFAMDNIHIYNPSAVANFQIVGNDIEIVNYPATGYVNAKCINFETSTKPGQFSEIEIIGNTIQGHGTSNYVLYFSGHSEEPIRDMNITGNHISNSGDSALVLENVMNVALTGNTYAEIKHYVYELAGVCTNVLMVGEIGRAINEGTVAAGGKLHAASTATLTNIKCKNTIFTDDDVDIETSSTTNVDVTEDVSGNGVSF